MKNIHRTDSLLIRKITLHKQKIQCNLEVNIYTDLIESIEHERLNNLSNTLGAKTGALNAQFIIATRSFQAAAAVRS